MGKLLRFLVLACVVQAVGAQGLFKGFVPDEGGTNLDAPSQQQKVSPGTIIKDCADCPDMVVLPSGSFLMGTALEFISKNSLGVYTVNPDTNESPDHNVEIESFAIGKYEVTQQHWYSIMKDSPSSVKAANLPVEQVSWNDVQNFIVLLNQKTGKTYRLPSEAEWEYAARAGSSTEWSFGNDESKLGNYAWYKLNSGGRTHPVGQKLPNAFGLHDMHGNAWEWVQDCWHDTYSRAPSDGSAWIAPCSKNNNRVIRGGSADDRPKNLRSSNRFWEPAGNRSFSSIGFRLARDL